MSIRAYSMKMGSAHWETYVVKIVLLHGEDPLVTEKCGVHFVGGFIFGFKYGVASETDAAAITDFARAYWQNSVEPKLKAEGTHPEVIRKCMVHYVLAFIHGFKHGLEAQDLFITET